jgi:ankyrin repeat protein
MRTTSMLVFVLLWCSSSAFADPLHEAAKTGDLQKVQELLTHGAYVNAQDSQAETPLHYAAAQGHKSVVEALLTAGTNVNAIGNGGETPVYRALAGNHQVIADLLFARGADRQGGRVFSRSLLEAVIADNVEEAKKLLDRGAPVNGEETLGSPLHIAAGHGSKEMVTLLLARGANVKTKNANSGSLLMSAVGGRSTEVAKLLLAHGADVDAVQDHGMTALLYACQWGTKEMIELLLAHKASTNVKTDPEGLTPLLVAVSMGRKDIAKLLLAHGANVNAKSNDNSGQTLLHLAVGGGDKELVELLLTYKVDVNLKDAEGRTPLDLATLAKRSEIMNLLAAHGATGDRRQLLHGALREAIQGEDIQKTKELLAQGADVNLKNEGQTPLQLALEKVDINLQMVEVLLAAKADERIYTRVGLPS